MSETGGQVPDIGRLALPESFFLLARDERTGELLMSDQLHGLALAAAQLAELVLANQVVISEGRAFTTPHRAKREAEAVLVTDIVNRLHERGLGTPAGAMEYIERHTFHPVPATAEQALKSVEENGARPVFDYLSYLGEFADEVLRAQLLAEGVVRVQPTRLPMRRPRVVTREEDLPTRVRAAVVIPLRRAEPLSARAAILLALALATGVDAARPLEWSQLRGPHYDFAQSRIRDALDPALTHLIDHLDAAVHRAVSARI